MNVLLKEESFAARLRIAIGKSSLRAFAQKAGISDALLRHCLSGKTEPTRPKLVAIARVAGVHLDWLAAGMEPIYLKPPEDSDYIKIPLYDLYTSAGTGAFVEHEHVVDYMVFKRFWIRNSLHTSPDNLSLITVMGDSMEPILKNDDIIMVNHSEEARRLRDDIFVIRIKDELFVKRLQKLPNERIKVISSNNAYESFYVDLKDVEDEYDFTIIGRVVWVSSKLH